MDAKTHARYQKIEDADYGDGYDGIHDRMRDQFIVAIDNMVAGALRNMIRGRGKGLAELALTESVAALEEYIAHRRT